MANDSRKDFTPLSLDGLRRRARAVKKAQGIPYHEALRAAAVEAGYADWHAAQTTLSRREVRPKAAANYAAIEPQGPIEKRVNSYRYLAHARGIRPPKRMAIVQHKEVGTILREVLLRVYGRVGVRHRIESMRATLEDWLGQEVGDELDGREFFDVYYGGTGARPDDPRKPPVHVDEVIEKLEAVRAILRGAYPNCKARDYLFNDIDQAKRLIGLWATGPQGAKRGSRALRPAIPAPNEHVGQMDAAQSLDYAIERLAVFLERFEDRWKRPGYRYSDEMRRDFPYALKLVADNTYILVNREYEPVGWATGDWVKYDEVSSKHVTLTAEELRSVLPEDRKSGLYGDSTTPWRKRRDAILYLGRLKHLRAIVAGGSPGQVAA